MAWRKQWLAVAATSKVVVTGYSHARCRHLVRRTATTATAHQTAQPTCREGMAAYSFTNSAAPSFAQITGSCITVSVTPGTTKRGGASGQVAYTTSALT